MNALIKRRGGFTLIELMIVVAIIGILAAIAIPNFLRFQLRSKASEGKTNLAAIRTAEEGYFAEFGTYLPVAAALPVAGAMTSKTVWPAPGAGANFDTLGWSPEGDVFYMYGIGAAVPMAGAPAVEFHAAAYSDIDGDGTLNQWAYVKPIPGMVAYTGGVAPPGVAACAAGGVYDPISTLTNLLETVGPCNNVSGQSIF